MKLKVFVAVVLLVNLCAGAAVDTKREKRTIGKVLGFFGFKIVPINQERNRPTEVVTFDAIREPQFKIPSRPQSQSQNGIRDEPFRINLPAFDVVSPSVQTIDQRVEVVTNKSPVVDVSSSSGSGSGSGSGATDDLISMVFNTDNFPADIAPTMRSMPTEIPMPLTTQSTPIATVKTQSLEPVLTFPASTDPFSTRQTIVEPSMPSIVASTASFPTRTNVLDPILPYPASIDPFSKASTLDIRQSLNIQETMPAQQNMNLQMQTIGLSPAREAAFKKFQELAMEYKNTQDETEQSGNSNNQNMELQNLQDQSSQSGNFQSQSGNFQGQSIQSQNFQGQEQNIQSANFQGQSIQSGNFQTQSTNLPQEQLLDSRINQEQSFQSGNTQSFSSRDFASSSGPSGNFASSSGNDGNFQSFPSNDVTSQFFSQPSYYINQGTPQNYQYDQYNQQQSDFQPNYLQNNPQQASSQASINMNGQQLHQGYTYHNPQFY
ncbi:unnamed protein product [Diamesa hyperborea]